MLFALLALGACATAQEAPGAATGLLISNVTVVDVRDGSLSPGQDLLVMDGRIREIGDSGTLGGQDVADSFDGAGAYVVPGFNDMHAHNLNTLSPQTSLPLMLSRGITGFRQMAPSMVEPAMLAELQPKRTPEVLALPGRLVVGPEFADPAAASAEVDRQHGEAVDFIKVIDVPPASLFAAADRAHQLGLPVAGHLPPAVSPRDAIAHHFTSIEHMGPGISVILSCSSQEEPIRARLAAAAAAGPGLDFSMPPEQLARMLANPMLNTPPQGFMVMQGVLATYDEQRCAALAQDIAASDSWVVPTLARLEAMHLGNVPELRDNPDLRLVPPQSRALWQLVGGDFDSRLSDVQRATLRQVFERQVDMVRIFDDAGVKMMTGSDFGGQWLVPGASLHHEFDLLARAGLSPLRILQMTTILPARYLGRENDMGTVEVGRAANLVLLSADPTADVSALHQIVGVVRDGVVIDRDGLSALEAESVALLQP